MPAEKFLFAPKRTWARVAYAALLLLAGAVTLPFGVPILSVNNFIKYSSVLPYGRSVKTEVDTPVELPQLYADMFGWPNQAKVISNAYYSIPASERANCAILAGNYGEAGAIDYYGRKYDLPKAISGHNSHYFWGPGDYTGSCVIIFGDNSSDYIKLFGDVTLAATISSLHATPGEQNLKVYICRKPHRAAQRTLAPLQNDHLSRTPEHPSSGIGSQPVSTALSARCASWHSRPGRRTRKLA